jgi:hypothetical protein
MHHFAISWGLTDYKPLLNLVYFILGFILSDLIKLYVQALLAVSNHLHPFSKHHHRLYQIYTDHEVILPPVLAPLQPIRASSSTCSPMLGQRISWSTVTL